MKISKLITIVLLLAVPVLIQTGCTSTAQYDIRGTWLVTLNYYDGVQDTYSFTFTGTSDTGVVTHTGIQYPGTYSVSGSSVDFNFEYTVLYTRSTESYSGTMTSDTTMNGSFEWDTTLIAQLPAPLVWAWGTFTAAKQ
jgi:hypothetical protein